MLIKTIEQLIEDLSKEEDKNKLVVFEWFIAKDFNFGDNTPIPNEEQFELAYNRINEVSFYSDLSDAIFDVIHETMALCETCNQDLGEDFNPEIDDYECEDCKKEEN